MEYQLKLIVIALLALLTGTAFASPLLIVPLDVRPFPQVNEGPKADFSIDLVYANFSVFESERNYTDLVPSFTADGNWSYVNVTRTIKETNINYTVVANITNLSDLKAKMYETCFAAAEDISIRNSILGGKYFNSVYNSLGVSFGGVINGVWLDGKWLNTTWIPGIDYPLSIFRVIDQNHESQLTIPDLPENATENGTWIEGVPVAEYYDITRLTATQIYINGAWVDLTGRIQANNPQPMVMANGVFADLVLTSSTPIYRNVGNTSAGLVTDYPSWGLQYSTGIPYRWALGDGFSHVWEPHQSKLIVFTGIQTFVTNANDSTWDPLETLESGTIDLYGSITNFISNMPINGTYYNTLSTATWLNTVQLEKKPNGYIYNAILADNQVFQLSTNGVEAYIKHVD